MKKTVSITIDDSLYKRAKDKAKEDIRTFSNYITYLIEKDLEAKKGKK